MNIIFLVLKKILILKKNKLIKEKRNEEERIKDIKEFNFRKK